MTMTTIGVDLAKNTFSLHGTNAQGKTMLKTTTGKLLVQVVNLPPCLIEMETCKVRPHWVQALRKLGHDARIVAQSVVMPARRNGKSDSQNDKHDRALKAERIFFRI